MSACVTDAMRAATHRGDSCRPGIFDLDAVKETMRSPASAQAVRGGHQRRAAAAAGCRVADGDAGAGKLSKLNIPVWGGQITQRANFSLALADGEGVREYDAEVAGRRGNRPACGRRSRNR